MYPRFFIYGLIDPRTDIVRYVGKSSVGMSRPRRHEKVVELLDTNRHKVNWIKGLQVAGLSYRIAILDVLEEPTGLDALEEYWIAYGRMAGWPLTNLTDGGEGAPGCTRSAETRAKLAAAKLGKKLGPYPPFTTEHRARLAEKKRGTKHSPDSLEKMRATLQRIAPQNSEKLRAKWDIPEWRQHQVEAREGKTASLETRARMRAAQRERRARERQAQET